MDKRIDEVCDERAAGGDFFVYLKSGFSFTDPPQHCFGAIDKAEIRRTMKRVRACRCDDCIEASVEAIMPFQPGGMALRR